MNAFLWIMQLILACAFLFTGISKIVAYKKLTRLIESHIKKVTVSIPKAEAVVIGITEILWALGLLYPFQLPIPYLFAVVSASCLLLEMLGATVYHLRRKESAVPSIGLGLVALFVLVSRWPWWDKI